ncbi:MAG: ATP-binding protein [Nitrospirota bacterium]
MSLQQKIIFGFLLSAVIITVLVVLGYTNFIEIKEEIRFLELSDTLRSKTLQLRRHEKNFFLYGDVMEINAVHQYINDLKTIFGQAKDYYDSDKLHGLEDEILKYEKNFLRIEASYGNFRKEFNALKPLLIKHSGFFPLIESAFLERPLIVMDIFSRIFLLQPDSQAVVTLREIDTEITSLRRTGEEILTISKDIDKSAREKVHEYINMTRLAVLSLFPLFLFVGVGAFIIISHNIVRRLKILTNAVEKAGKGDFSSLVIPSGHDEVGVLISAFINMEKDLIARDEQLNEKNRELLHNKKLASIGTLASGVAHELNNPLNNIYTTAQRLLKKSGDECSPSIKKGLDDIFDQTMRVKRIVGDLLEFARGREPQYREFELTALLSGVYNRLADTMNARDVIFTLESSVPSLNIQADQEQIERVFINMFSNAVEAMSGQGSLTVRVEPLNDIVSIRIADTGMGIPSGIVDKIFEPFYTTKDKGTGLGLAIVFNIIQKHNGRIKVESGEGKGTVFIITLPVRSEHHVV